MKAAHVAVSRSRSFKFLFTEVKTTPYCAPQAAFASVDSPLSHVTEWQQSRAEEEEEQSVQRKMWKELCLYQHVYSVMRWVEPATTGHWDGAKVSSASSIQYKYVGINITDIWINPPSPNMLVLIGFQLHKRALLKWCLENNEDAVPLRLERICSGLKSSGVSKAKMESLSWINSRSSSSSQKERWKPS